MKQRGFTLVEMLIALSIFGMITAAGVALLSVSARTQETSDRILGELGEVRRVHALMTADFVQAAPRLYRDDQGRPQRAFAGDRGEAEMLLLFVRRGWDDGAGGGLQRVGYRLSGGALERLSFAHVDGGGGVTAVRLLGRVRALRLRYRDREGAWLDRWQPSDGTRLPIAVELIVDSEAHGLIRHVFLVGNAS
jgi:general secretion pathway protein J